MPMTTAVLALTLAAAPATQPVSPATRPASQPAGHVRIVSRAEWADREPMLQRLQAHTPKRLTIHHAGVDDDGKTPGEKKMRGLLQFSQEQKPWGDVPYHFIIDRSGRVFEGRSVKWAPDTNTGYDTRGHIGICVNGNLTSQPLNESQYRSLIALLVDLTARLGLSDETIAGHMDASPGKTDCPGVLERFIRDGSIRKDMAAVRAGKRFAFTAPPPGRVGRGPRGRAASQPAGGVPKSAASRPS